MEVPEILIDTPRLQMRHFCIDDVDAVFAFSTNPEVCRYTGDAGTVKTRQDAMKLITDLWQEEYQRYGYARYALIHKGDNKVIGFCGVKYLDDEQRPDIGYRMLPQYWGQGLAYEAAQATMDYARNELGLTNIMAEAVVENIASNKILLKLGLTLVDNYQRYGFNVNRYE
ncbi:GNAT family N-acetyltransferase [Paraferrimonas haliotis]|uniref:N-acetyltransferase GCN5 n=1 Tax=Paraferrimonas haliotis TaxID=2013866 RepID=A0AA37WWF9_9GAMM|nr:GNAT family N-acetyltransferase [Paraferrimonas haliotis]GLS83432.1 N-acetyltransferase GCN5 [Paraferrimonas haliotis]